MNNTMTRLHGTGRASANACWKFCRRPVSPSARLQPLGHAGRSLGLDFAPIRRL